MEPSGDVAQRDPGDPHRRRGKYGVDGGNVGVPMVAVVEAGPAGTLWWALRRGRRGIASVVGLASLTVAVAHCGPSA
jgi:hypothetical protein